MIIGSGAEQLDRRITKAMCSGSVRPNELAFLQSISHKLDRHRERAFISDKQASWLFTILTSVENEARFAARTNSRSARNPHPPP